MTDTFTFSTIEELLKLEWKDFKPLYTELEKTALTENSIEQWLKAWTYVSEVQDELYNRLYVATSINTADKNAQARFDNFIEHTFPQVKKAEQKLKEKLLASELSVPGFEIPLRNMRAEADIFREENLALFVEEEKLATVHDQIMGAQAVKWQGEDKTVRQMEIVLRKNDRETRRKGWELMAERQLADRDAINKQWVKFMTVREKIAAVIFQQRWH